MQVVLNDDVKKLGYKGDVVTVKPGYFRNFLMPRGLADMATPALLKLTEGRKEKTVLKKQELLDKAKEAVDKLKGLKVSVRAKVSDKGKLYAAINEADVIAAIETASKIRLEEEFLKMEHFKELGEYKALVHLGDGMEEEITVSVEPKEDKK